MGKEFNGSLVSLLISIHGLLIWSAVILPSVCQQVSQSSLLYEDERHWHTHPRAPVLCARDFSGFEGTTVKGFELDRVIALTTPGLTFDPKVDSLLGNAGHSKTHCHFHKFAKLHPSDKIKSYTDVLWMKDRIVEKSKQGSAFKVFKHVPVSIRCKENMLTPQGVVQAVQLGEYLAISYLNSLNSLLNTKAHSVGDEVLYQSVNAVLYGLLTEKEFVRAGIGKLSQHYTDNRKSWAETEEHLSHFVKESFRKEHHLFKDESSPTGDRWTIDSEFGRGIPAKDILSSILLKYCDKKMKDTLHISHDLIHSVLSVSDLHNKYLLNSSIFKNYSKSTSFPFRKFMSDWISSFDNSKDGDFKLVSVDDLFLLNVLSVFGHQEVEHIPPASRLVIERFHQQHSSLSHLEPSTATAMGYDIASSSSLLGSIPTRRVASHPKFPGSEPKRRSSKDNNVDQRNVYLRVLYNGKVVTGDVLNCRSDPFASLGLCSMPSFVNDLMSEETNSYRDEL